MEKVVDDCAGYDFDFVDGLQEDQFCPICKGVIRDPLQIVECGHQCCEYCFTRSQRYGRYMYTFTYNNLYFSSDLITPV